MFKLDDPKTLLIGGAAIIALLIFRPWSSGGSTAASPQLALAQLAASTSIALGQQQVQANAVAANAQNTRAQLQAALAGKQMDTSLQAGIAAANALAAKASADAQSGYQMAALDAGVAQAHIYADTASAISLNQANTAKALAPIYVNAQTAQDKINAGVAMSQLSAQHNPSSFYQSPAQQAEGWSNAASNIVGGVVKIAPQIASLFGGGASAGGAAALGGAAAGALVPMAGDSFSAVGDAASLAANTIPDAAVSAATTGDAIAAGLGGIF